MARLVDSWLVFWRDTPGQRFERWHKRLARYGGGLAGRIARVVLGLLLFTVAIAMLPFPLPGLSLAPAMLGGALLAGESRRIATTLDRTEVRVRGWLR